jgi:hypothetical protein
MQSKIIALLAPEGSREATLLVRRANGQFALERIDARVAHARRVAAAYDGCADPEPEREVSVA